jgi:hypothetical protein
MSVSPRSPPPSHSVSQRPAAVQPPPAMERPPAASAAPLLRNQTARPAWPNAHPRNAELSWRPPPVHTHSTHHQRSARTHAAALQTHAWKPERNPQRLTEQLVRVFVQRPCLCAGACGALVALVGRREGAPVGVSGVVKVRSPGPEHIASCSYPLPTNPCWKDIERWSGFSRRCY